MFYYLLQFCFGSVYLEWCIHETDSYGFIRFIEERHEHSQKILKRILHFCSHHRDNTSLDALNYLDKKILLGIKYGFYNFLKIINDASINHGGIIKLIDGIIAGDGWFCKMHPDTKKYYRLFAQINGTNIIPVQLSIYNYQLPVHFIRDVHVELHAGFVEDEKDDEKIDILLGVFLIFCFSV